MARHRKPAYNQTITTVQQLSSLIKSARDIMRKDKGLNGDLDRLPMLTWIMFLKFLDDVEMVRAQEAELRGEKFRPTIQRPYRWRDWAAQEDGITGEELLRFVNQDEAIRHDGKKGEGLLAHLRSFQSANGRDRRDVIANVFRGVQNRMINGYLLRDVINKVNDIHFNSSEEIHTLSHLYETMLREMRDAAGDSGEFYTPRPVVQFMVAVMEPQLGETILDPACGTGGFLVETYKHLENRCQTVEERIILQEDSIFGQEAKPLPYMLAQMNLLLHGLEYPNIAYDNSLNVRIQEIGDRDRVDVILTNPPFGGEEEVGIKSNFPDDLQTSETALLFLQLIMRKLKRPEKNNGKPGRAAVVVPDGILSQEGVASKIRKELVEKYNLNTIVRLPKGVFEPYTKSSTSILFFDRASSSEYVWFYEIPVRSDIKAYTQHRPFTFSECKEIIEWWGARKENKRAWMVPRDNIEARSYNLNFKNPNAIAVNLFDKPEHALLAVDKGIKDFQAWLDANKQIWEKIQTTIANNKFDQELLGDLIKPIKRTELLVPDIEYYILAMSWYAKGMYIKYKKSGANIKAKKLYRVKAGDFVYNRLFAWKGSFAEATQDVDGCHVSNEFPTFEIVDPRVKPGYLWAFFSQPSVWSYIESLSSGTSSTSRLRLKENRLLTFKIPLPPPQLQQEIASFWHKSLDCERKLQNLSNMQRNIVPAMLERAIPMEIDF